MVMEVWQKGVVLFVLGSCCYSELVVEWLGHDAPPSASLVEVLSCHVWFQLPYGDDLVLSITCRSRYEGSVKPYIVHGCKMHYNAALSLLVTHYRHNDWSCVA